MPTPQEGQLIGTWLHSHEEDTSTERIYRRLDYPFPRSRGRAGYEFRANGSCTYLGIAAIDGTEKQPCTWQLNAGARTEIILTFPGARRDVLTVVTLESDRLVIKRL